MLTFQLVDSLKTAFSLGKKGMDGAITGVKTSNYSQSPLCGMFECLTTGAKSSSFGYQSGQLYTIRMFISADGTQNYLYVNDELIAGGLDGVKRTDFFGGYAYLHILNTNSTNLYHCLVSQDFELQLQEAQNGSYEISEEEGLVAFKKKVELTADPEPGYGLKSVTVGDKTYYPERSNYVEFYKGWGDETVTVEFGRSYTLTFDTDGGNQIASQTVTDGELFYRPANPKKEGYKFAGWYTDENFTAEFNFTLTPSADVTAYAKWEPVQNTDEGCSGGAGAGSGLLAVLAMACGTVAFKKKRS